MSCHAHNARPRHHAISLPCHCLHHAMTHTRQPMPIQLHPITVGCHSSVPSTGPRERMLKDVRFVLPSKRSHVHSSSCLHLRSCSHSPPCHCQCCYASPDRSSKDTNAQGRRNRNTGRKGKGRNTNSSFFQGGTAARGASTCAICLGRHELEYAKCAASKLWNRGKVCMRRNKQGRLVFLDSLPVCFSFQTLAGCSDPSHPL